MVSHIRRTWLTGLVAIGFALTSGVAWAFWTASGTGTATADTGTINAPTAVAAGNTAGSSLVVVSWMSSTPAAGVSPTGYYVTRVRNSDGASSSACGSSPASPTATTPCNDTSVPDGSYHFVVTGVLSSWTAPSGSSNNVTVSTDVTPPSVTVEQKSGQADPTKVSPMLWTVTFSEPVTGFDSTDLTRGGTSTGGTIAVTGTGASYEISLSGSPENGSTTFVIAASKAQDLAGNANNASTSADNSITYDTISPTVTGVSSTLANGTYKAGQVIPLTVTFSENVTVTGTPQLTLSTGSPTTTPVNYSSGSGTNVLTFNYTVAASNTSADLDYAATTSLALNSGTIADPATNNATLTLASPGATGSLGANKALVIDTTAPSAVGLTTTNAGTDRTLDLNDTFTLTYSEAIDPSSIIAAWDGTGSRSVVVQAAHGSGNDKLTVYDSTNTTLLPLGTVDLKDTQWLTTSRTFGATGTASTITRSGATFTITLGTPSGSVTRASSNTNLSWIPAAGATDLAGNAASITAFTQTDNKSDF
jgi:Bacterial Ig-like domain